MRVSQARCLALRLTVPQNIPIDKSVYKIPPTAFLLAAIGLSVSSFSLKQMLATKQHLNMK
nr:unnamed protein product [Callosobruchus chinensis]